MTLEKILETMVKNTIDSIKGRISMWKEMVVEKEKAIEKLLKKIKEFQANIIIEYDLLEKYENLNIQELLEKQKEALL